MKYSVTICDGNHRAVSKTITFDGIVFTNMDKKEVLRFFNLCSDCVDFPVKYILASRYET